VKRSRPFRFLVFLCALVWIACGSGADESPPETAKDLTLALVFPEALVPQTLMVLEGNFLDIDPAFVEIVGKLDDKYVNALIPAKQTGLGRIEAKWPGGTAAGFPSPNGTFEGTVRVRGTIGGDAREHVSNALSVILRFADKLEPTLYAALGGQIFVNDQILVDGADFLIGDAEGSSVAILEGCFTPQSGGACVPVPDTVVPMAPDELSADPVSVRRKASFPFVPSIAGIEPGVFEGSIRVRNDHEVTGQSSETAQVPLQLQLIPTTLGAITPDAGSLGQYIDLEGGGFVGKWSNIPDPTTQTTLLLLAGDFTPTGAPASVPVNLELVTEFVSGNLVRYVLSEDDALGAIADLRSVTGTFNGTATPVARYGSVNVTGNALNVTLSIAPVKQVVWVSFLDEYRKSLESLGLRAADSRIRDRMIEVMQRDYLGVNVEFRLEEPRDFALYATVELSGKDPNNQGLLGYDNTPGKDVDCESIPGKCIYNKRLYDKIGGVNAKTQEDGYNGYGGVFIQSLFAFSQHPGTFADSLEDVGPEFDQIFDPFRPDRGGKPVQIEELAVNVPILQTGYDCPAPKSDRKLRIACAIFVLGSLIGTTTSHEIAHSLGLADPDGQEFHNLGDEPNRLMDSGGARSFLERAELMGQGPGVFCAEEYLHLKNILPNPVPDPVSFRPPCN
jgi:hypothetical protein